MRGRYNDQVSDPNGLGIWPYSHSEVNVGKPSRCGARPSLGAMRTRVPESERRYSLFLLSLL